MAFLLDSQAQGVSGKNEQSTQTPWRGTPEERGPMQLHRLHRLKAGPVRTLPGLDQGWTQCPTLNVVLYQVLPVSEQQC